MWDAHIMARMQTSHAIVLSISQRDILIRERQLSRYIMDNINRAQQIYKILQFFNRGDEMWNKQQARYSWPLCPVKSNGALTKTTFLYCLWLIISELIKFYPNYPLLFHACIWFHVFLYAYTALIWIFAAALLSVVLKRWNTPLLILHYYLR